MSARNAILFILAAVCGVACGLAVVTPVGLVVDVVAVVLLAVIVILLRRERGTS
jgi:hypothetical protein